MDAPGATEIGFEVPEIYNASEILFRNLERHTATEDEQVLSSGFACVRTRATLCVQAGM